MTCNHNAANENVFSRFATVSIVSWLPVSSLLVSSCTLFIVFFAYYLLVLSSFLYVLHPLCSHVLLFSCICCFFASIFHFQYSLLYYCFLHLLFSHNVFCLYCLLCTHCSLLLLFSTLVFHTYCLLLVLIVLYNYCSLCAPIVFCLLFILCTHWVLHLLFISSIHWFLFPVHFLYPLFSVSSFHKLFLPYFIHSVIDSFLFPLFISYIYCVLAYFLYTSTTSCTLR